MRKIWAVSKREFLGFFTTPIGYITVGMYALITGLGFVWCFIDYVRISQDPASRGYPGVPDLEEFMLSPFLVFCGHMLLLLAPLITMRLLAEEKNRGTMELLYTLPLRDRDIIFGKYIASLGLVLTMVVVVALDMVLISWFTDIEPAVLLFGLLTVFLMGAAFLSLGLFVSALSRSQITAATVTFGLFLTSSVVGALGKGLPEACPVPEAWTEGTREWVMHCYGVFRQVVLELPLDTHAEAMAQGILQPEDVAYYLLFPSFFLFLTFRVLEARKWRTSA